MPPRGPVTGSPHRCRSTVLSVLFFIKEKASHCTHSTVRCTCFQLLQQGLMPRHSVEEPSYRRPLCAQVVCSHTDLLSEPTAWPATPLHHLHRADATIELCMAVMGCRSAMLPGRPSRYPCPIGHAALPSLAAISQLSGVVRELASHRERMRVHSSSSSDGGGGRGGGSDQRVGGGSMPICAAAQPRAPEGPLPAGGGTAWRRGGQEGVVDGQEAVPGTASEHGSNDLGCALRE